MKFAFVVDPLDHLKAWKDSTVAMMREAARRSHEVYALEPFEIWLQESAVMARARKLVVSDRDDDWYRAADPEEVPLSFFDLVKMRKDPPFDSEYYYATILLQHAQAQGARVLNSPQALRDWNEKLSILGFPQFTPAMIVTRDPARIQSFIERERDVILKRLDGMGGTMIFRVKADDLNRNVIVETMVGDAEQVLVTAAVPEDVPAALAGRTFRVTLGSVEEVVLDG